MKKIVVHKAIPLFLLGLINPPTVKATPLTVNEDNSNQQIENQQISDILIVGNEKATAELMLDETIARLRQQLTGPSIDWAAVQEAFEHMLDRWQVEADTSQLDEMTEVVEDVQEKLSEEAVQNMGKKLDDAENQLEQALLKRHQNWEFAIAKLEDELIDTGGRSGFTILGDCFSNMSGRLFFGIKDTDL